MSQLEFEMSYRRICITLWHTHTHTHTHTHKHTHTYTHTYKHTHTHTQILTNTHTHPVYIHTHTLYIYTHPVYIYTPCIYTHTHTHTHIHTHTHTHTHKTIFSSIVCSYFASFVKQPCIIALVSGLLQITELHYIFVPSFISYNSPATNQCTTDIQTTAN